MNLNINGISADMMNWLTSVVIMLIFIGLAFIVRFLLVRIVHLFTRRTKTIFDDLIVQAVATPVFVALIVAGVWIGLNRTPQLAQYLPVINKIFTSILILILAVVIARVVNAILAWYGTEVATRTKTDVDNKLLPLLRRVATAVIYVLALLFVLQQYIQIAPLLAGLGIGGVAVALALQPTLSNFLAGTYVMSDAVIHKGDYIMIDSGQEGTVEDVGWRSTKIRQWQGNLVIMPNSKLSDAIVIDYEKPDKSMSFTVDCGVSYENDLEKVERIVLEVATDILQRCPEGDKDTQPAMRFKEFGDSNINFAVVLKSVDRAGQFPLKHAFIKALHKRFKEEEINIQYPARKIYFASEKGSKIPV